ncbi:AbrB/MazE/SpoVT family DNA-binding domain-containing protein [Candidatus Woesearchaeota archaeon]|nr:AbrB/MazE/SpoVT family DNA-binding domain-containing protein [Candidatus Woesearchaeota archaeon]
MDVETIRMSSKGQVVIPQQIRDKLHAVEGTVFAVVGGKDSIILKKIATPTKEDLINELVAIAKEGKKRLQKKGISEEDIPYIV